MPWEHVHAGSTPATRTSCLFVGEWPSWLKARVSGTRDREFESPLPDQTLVADRQDILIGMIMIGVDSVIPYKRILIFDAGAINNLADDPNTPELIAKIQRTFRVRITSSTY